MPAGQVEITDLPQAQALAGTESVPIVQFGVTVQTTTGAIAGSSLQATSLGVTNITATGTLNLSSASISGLASLSVTNGLTSGLASVGGLIVNDAADSHIHFSSNQGLTASSTNPVMNKTINIISAVGTAPFNVLTPSPMVIGRNLYVFNDTANSIIIIITIINN